MEERQRRLKEPASVVLAAALAAQPEDLKREWHRIGESLSCCQFAYLVSHVLGGQRDDNALSYTRPQEEFLAGCAELFSEALVSQADKSMVSWRTFSQALVSATIAAGPPPRIATDARLARHRVVLEGVAVEESRVGGGAVKPADGPHGVLPPLEVTPDVGLYYMPAPMDRLLACEPRHDASGGGARFKISLFQMTTTPTHQSDSCVRSNVLLEHSNHVECVTLVPTVKPPADSAREVGGPRELSVGALATGLSIVSGSTARSLTIWILATPPGAAGAKRRFRVDDIFTLGTSAPIACLATGTSATGGPLLYGGTSAGTVLCWDVASWSLRHTFAAHTSETSCLVALPSLQYVAAAYMDGTVKVWPHGATLADRQTASIRGQTRAINAIAWSKERKQVLVAAGRRVHIWNPVLAERVKSLPDHHDTLVAVAALPSLIVTADISGHVHVTDATCYEELQTMRLFDSSLPINIAPMLHQAFVFNYQEGEMLIAAAGALTLLKRVEGEDAIAAVVKAVGGS